MEENIAKAQELFELIDPLYWAIAGGVFIAVDYYSDDYSE